MSPTASADLVVTPKSVPTDNLQSMDLTDEQAAKIAEQLGSAMRETEFKDFVAQRLSLVGAHVDDQLAKRLAILASETATMKKGVGDHLTAVADKIERTLLDQLEAATRRIIDRAPVVMEIRAWGKAVAPVENAHRVLPSLILNLQEGLLNILMKGPAQSGKTTVARDLARALSLEFGHLSLSSGIQEYHLLGRCTPPDWTIKETAFVRIFRDGGVFLLDEIDAADPNLLVTINSALANGILALPDGGHVTRHEKCVIIGAANTWGTGPDAEYVGRNALDVATLERFVLATHLVDYDVDLESRISKALLEKKPDSSIALLGWITELRGTIKEKKLRRVASTRLVENASRALAAGGTLKDVKHRYFQSWSQQELDKLPGTCRP